MTLSAPRITILGAGIFGVSAALHLARLGAAVTLVSDAPPATGATGRSLAWLNSSRIASEAYHRLRMIGIDRYRTLAARVPESADWLSFTGGLSWDAPGAGNDIAAIHAQQVSRGYDSHLLDAEEAGLLFPGLDTSSIPAEGALFNPGEGWVELVSLVDHLLAEFEDLGGSLVTDGGPAALVTAGGRATGARTADGRLFAGDAVVVAGGAAVPEILATLGIAMPDATPIALLVRSQPLNHGLRMVVNAPRIALRPMPDGGIALDHDWASEEVIRHPDGTFTVRPETLAGLLRETSALLAGHPEIDLATYGVGRKPIPLDGEPAFGPVESLPGCHLLFSHSGATLGLIAGELLAREIVTGTPHPMLEGFRPARFLKR